MIIRKRQEMCSDGKFENPQKNARSRQHTNQGKQNHTKWIERAKDTLTLEGYATSTGITQSGLKEICLYYVLPEL